MTDDTIKNVLHAAQSDRLVARYVELRDTRDEIKARIESELEPYETAMGAIAIELDRRMIEDGSTAIKTTAGTASRVITQTVACADWVAFDRWVVANNRPDVFSRKLNTGPFKEMLEAGASLPPGVRMEQAARVQVRRATRKS